LSAFAYTAARRLAKDNRFAFGTWKIEVLAGFASAVFLICIAALMVVVFLYDRVRRKNAWRAK
jgi:Co/Zn/Cd efflux system component